MLQDGKKDVIGNGEVFRAEVTSLFARPFLPKPLLSWPQESLKAVSSCAPPFVSPEHTCPSVQCPFKPRLLLPVSSPIPLSASGLCVGRGLLCAPSWADGSFRP